MNFSGKTVLITRPKGQAGETVAELERQGAKVIHIPLIEIADPSDHYRGLDEALKKIYEYHWIVFTSQNAVTRFFARPLAPSGEELQQRVAAVGPQTAKLLKDLGVVNLVVADEATSDALIRSLQSYDWKGKRVLFPRAKEGRDVVVSELCSWGAEVDVVEAYQTIFPHDFDRERFMDVIRGDKIDVVHFASPSAVKNFAKVIDEMGLREKLKKIHFLAIGPTTMKVVQESGFPVWVRR